MSYREAAKENLVKAKIFRFVAIVMFVMAFFLAAILYAAFSSNGVEVIIKNPLLVLIILLPFLPAAFFSWRSSVHAETLQKLVQEEEQRKLKEAGASSKTS